MEKIDSELRSASTRVRFSVQSGQPWTLTEKDVFSRFSSFVKIDTVSFVGYYKSCGIITFSSASEAERNLNKVVVVKGCLVHTTTDFYDLPPFSVEVNWSSFNFIATFRKYFDRQNSPFSCK